MREVSVTVNFLSPRNPAGRGKDARPFPHCTYTTEPYESIWLEPHRVLIRDIREELDVSSPDVPSQLDARGFAIGKDEMKVSYDELTTTAEGVERYINETCEMIKRKLGATAVYSWNHQIRKSEGKAPMSLDDLPKPESPLPAGRAHVDQDTPRARELIEQGGGSIGLLHGNRAQIVNVWRPMKGPVEDFPLAMCDYHTLLREDSLVSSDHYGSHHSILHNSRQKWSYIRDQTPNEVIFLRCYDTLEGSDGRAMYTPHTAFCDEDRKDCGVPRESIEVRCIVVHEGWTGP